MKSFIISFLAVSMIIGACSGSMTQPETSTSLTQENDPGDIGAHEEILLPVTYHKADYYLDNILSGGVPPDGIPPIDAPQFISVKEAMDLYDSKDPMFITNIDGQTYLFPQSIMVWHEIVNLEAAGLAITYCPLTGSCIAYEYPDNITTSFGTSGSLLNSNLVMYDRLTDTYISQIDGVGLDHDMEGLVLDTIPSHWVDFGTASSNFPMALVLSERTGFLRNYTQDPYGSYRHNRVGNYYTEEGTIFPVLNEDTTYNFHDKEMVVGIKGSTGKAALVKTAVEEDTPLHFTIGTSDYTAIWDPSIANIRIYEGHVTDLNSKDLISPTYFEVMWFAWYAFYPETEVIQ